MADQVYIKIEGVKGPLQVDGFSDHFEAHGAEGGQIVNHFTASNNGQAFSGVPELSNLRLSIKNCTADVSSTLHQKTLKAEPLTSVKVSQITRVKGKDTETYGMLYDKPHIIRYDYEASSGDLFLEVGNFASVETTHYNISPEGDVKPMRVKHDLTKNTTT